MIKLLQTKPNTVIKGLVYLILGFYLSFGYSEYAYAQYMTGTNISSYAGVNNVLVNPAMMANSRYYVDVNIGSVGSFFHNNFAYFDRDEYSIFSLFRPDYSFPVHNKEYGTGERTAYTVENTRLKNVFLNARILGPSAMVAYNNHSFAFQTSIRTVSSFTDVPYDMANYFYYSLDYQPQHGVEYEHSDPIKSASLSWSEVGFSWSYIFGKYNRDNWVIGVTAKMLFGHAAYYIYFDHIKYFVPDDDNLYIRNVNGETAYSLPIDYSTNQMYNGSTVKGMGMGFDLGFSYIHTDKGHSNVKYEHLCQQKFHEYKYRIGVSLMDFGWIGFNDVARKYEFDNMQGTWHEVDTLEPYYTNLDYISDDVSTRLCGTPDCALKADNFTMYLPFSLGVQFDYHHFKNWYLSGSFRLPLRYARSQVRASANIMVVPRMETEAFEFGMPFTLHEFRQPIVGAYLRYYNITAGTDNIAGFLNLTHHYGFDFYISLKISFVKNRCKRKGPRFCGGDYNYRM